MELTSPPCTVQEAVQHASWFARYALDRLGSDGRLHDPGVRSHLVAARTALLQAERHAQPDMDQIRAEA